MAIASCDLVGNLTAPLAQEAVDLPAAVVGLQPVEKPSGMKSRRG